MIRQACCLVTLVLLPTAASGADDTLAQTVRKELNDHWTVDATEDAKSYRAIFDAYLDVAPPPQSITEDFNAATIHPAMDDWEAVADWAESHQALADALIEVRYRSVVGLPYGPDEVSDAYRQAGIYVGLAPTGSLRDVDFAYLDALDVIQAFAAAETYRRLETGDIQGGLDLAVANIMVMRQFCDRDFLGEKLRCIPLLSTALSNLRDQFYLYLDKIDADQFVVIAWRELPFLRPDRNRLFMPEADRVVAEALISEVFDESTGSPVPDRFASVFAAIQSVDQPLTRFGAARRWKMISEVHGSLDASLERLTLVYDDWWRRWRVEAYDEILDIPSWFERTNKVRYAAVVHSMEDLEELFAIRNRLVVEVNGTAMAAGLCGYKATLGTFPNDSEKTYAQFVRKRSDVDPYDTQFEAMPYRLLTARTAVDTHLGRLWLEPDEAFLYSRGQDHADDRGSEHSDDGFSGDILLWPPVKALARQQGHLN